jgi:hypothetical protein
MDMSFRNNQSWILTLNIAAWAPIYPLAACVFHMQMRTNAVDVAVVYSWSSNPADGWGNGVISYTPATHLLTISAPKADMTAILPGAYQYDLLLNYLGIFKDLTSGQIVFDGGVTRG